MKLFLVTHRQTSYRDEEWETIVAVFFAQVAPDVILINSGSVYELKTNFGSEIAALRWWIQNGSSVNVSKDCTKVKGK